MQRMVLLLLILSSAFFGQDQATRFHGAYIGEALSDFVDCSSGKGKVLKEGYKSHGKLCEGKQGFISRVKYSSAFLGSPKGSGEVFFFEGHKLATIKIFIPNEDWDKVRYDLTEKLGPPASEVPQVFQNGFGARWEYDHGFWVKGNVVAYAGVKVHTLGGQAISRPFSNQPETTGIEVTITDAEHAKLPSTTPNSMD